METVRLLLTLIKSSIDYITIILGLYFESECNHHNKMVTSYHKLENLFGQKVFMFCFYGTWLLVAIKKRVGADNIHL